MAKKIYDIIPPKVAHKVEKELKEFLSADKNHARQAGKKTTHRRKSASKFSFNIKWLYALLAVAVLVVVVFLFFKLQKADIEIWPKVDVLSFEKTITADKLVESVDVAGLVIPAKYIEASETVLQDFPSTGNATDEGRASGTIIVYNKMDPPASLTLKTGTHFISDSGKLFVASQKIVVPAGKKSGGKITPGSVQVAIKAVEGGEGYNIPPSNFSVPGLKGTAYYYNIYAKSTEAMAGGYEGKVKKVTDDDIQGAKDVLVKKATDQATASLKGQLSGDYVLLDSGISFSTIEASTPAKAGQTVNNFTYKATVKASALAFKKADLEKFAKDYILSQSADGRALLDSSFKAESATTTVDVSGGKATLNLTFSSGVYKDIDKNSTSLLVLGKNANQINEIITSKLGDQASRVKVNLWPFWTTKAPNNQKAVKIELKF